MLLKSVSWLGLCVVSGLYEASLKQILNEQQLLAVPHRLYFTKPDAVPWSQPFLSYVQSTNIIPLTVGGVICDTNW